MYCIYEMGGNNVILFARFRSLGYYSFISDDDALFAFNSIN